LIVAVTSVPLTADAQGRFGITLGAGVIGGADAAPATNFSVPVYAVSIQRAIKRYFSTRVAIVWAVRAERSAWERS
jgi:hypothetical protein